MASLISEDDRKNDDFSNFNFLGNNRISPQVFTYNGKFDSKNRIKYERREQELHINLRKWIGGSVPRLNSYNKTRKKNLRKKLKKKKKKKR